MASTSLEEEIKERLGIRRLERTGNSESGCISSGRKYTIDDEDAIFVKTNDSLNAAIMFHGEFESLKQIHATKTIRVPKPRLVLHDWDNKGTSAIVMEYIDIGPVSVKSAEKLGEALANLHDYNSKVIRFNQKSSLWVGRKIPSVNMPDVEKLSLDNNDDDSEEQNEENQFTKHRMIVPQDKKHNDGPSAPSNTEFADRFVPASGTQEIHEFGFDLPTSCGSIPQINEWTSDWVSFYARYRLEHPIQQLLSDHSDRELMEQWSHLQLKVDKFFKDLDKNNESDRIVPALVHGDLWSGNVAETRSNNQPEPVVYDASSFYAHSEYDFGIARMFGGLPQVFERAYFKVMPQRRMFEQRNKLYQLFHHLNHWNHFGSGYRTSSLRLIKDLNAIV